MIPLPGDRVNPLAPLWTEMLQVPLRPVHAHDMGTS
jgi:hypothetical protein